MTIFFGDILQIPPMLSPAVESNPGQSMTLIQQTGISEEQLSLISRFAVASIGSQGTVGGLVVAGFVSVTLWKKVQPFIEGRSE